MRIAEHHTWSDEEYNPHHDWPGNTLVQWGGDGLVLDDAPYHTAFFEAFPDANVSAAGGFIRGEGATIEEAEDDAYAIFLKEHACRHLWGREHYRNGGQLCRHCRAFRCKEVKEVVILGRHRKQIPWYHAHMLDTRSNKPWARLLRLRASLFGIEERPPRATPVDEFLAAHLPANTTENADNG